VDELIALLARIVNSATNRTMLGSAPGCPLVGVPLALLEKARDYLRAHAEDGTEDVRQAAQRQF
jgi:hypothetical protein